MKRACNVSAELFVVGGDWIAALNSADRTGCQTQPEDAAHQQFVASAGLMNLAAASAPRPHSYLAHSDANLHSRVDDILITTDMTFLCPTATVHVSQDLMLNSDHRPLTCTANVARTGVVKAGKAAQQAGDHDDDGEPCFVTRQPVPADSLGCYRLTAAARRQAALHTLWQTLHPSYLHKPIIKQPRRMQACKTLPGKALTGIHLGRCAYPVQL